MSHKKKKSDSFHICLLLIACPFAILEMNAQVYYDDSHTWEAKSKTWYLHLFVENVAFVKTMKTFCIKCIKDNVYIQLGDSEETGSL